MIPSDSFDDQVLSWRVASVTESEAKVELTGTLQRLEAATNPKMSSIDTNVLTNVVKRSSKNIVRFGISSVVSLPIVLVNIYLIVASTDEWLTYQKDKTTLAAVYQLQRAINSTCSEMQASFRAVISENHRLSELEAARLTNDEVLKMMPDEFVKPRFLFGTLLVGRTRLQSVFQSIRQKIDTSATKDIILIGESYVQVLDFLTLNMRYTSSELVSLASVADFRMYQESVSNNIRWQHFWLQFYLFQDDRSLNNQNPKHKTMMAYLNITKPINLWIGLNKTRLFSPVFTTFADIDWQWLNDIRRLCKRVNSSIHSNLCSFSNETYTLLHFGKITEKLNNFSEHAFLALLEHNLVSEKTVRFWIILNSLLGFSVVLALIIFTLCYHMEYRRVESLMEMEAFLDGRQNTFKDVIIGILSEFVPKHLCIDLVYETLDQKAVKKGLKTGVWRDRINVFLQYFKCFALPPTNQISPMTKPIRNTQVLYQLAQETCKCMRNPALPISWLGLEDISCSDSTKKIEVHDHVTLLKLDIPYLNKLLNIFSPNEFLTFVTTLTKILNERLRLYDVFALSQNVDSYTIISGISQQQANNHTTEIANLALDIMCTCSDLELTVGCDTKIRPRIAIHTGNRIVLSENTATQLRQKGLYNTQLKGFNELSNGKKIGSYWLTGRRVSECRPNKEADVKIRRQLAMPIKLEQKPLYCFDNIASRPWLSPLPSPGLFDEDENDKLHHYFIDDIDIN